ncbi:MAG: RdgB/HAM1 family non-canonical purine NTP pyrophosphatase [Armatimonadetes bacterium]|nr:RdgB/HAM1 family non-canonical purine NTP pyrophosphatase [Armatimonadota bacterium]MDW8122616.1 RdgB/HAM1 family non-canonical purine NTP pyrophosphatase [Armatimonadota bacterium]
MAFADRTITGFNCRMKPKTLVIATLNENKAREIGDLLTDLPVHQISLSELGLTEGAEERSLVSESVARAKAISATLRTALPALAEDVSLEVDALNGAPGPLARRYFGPNLSDRDRCQALLRMLDGVPIVRRRCRFVCEMAVAFPWGEVFGAQGVLEGWIALEPAGHFGFGYDPIFFVPTMGRTLAQLSLKEKNQISHRAKAFQALKRILVTRLSLEGVQGRCSD